MLAGAVGTTRPLQRNAEVAPAASPTSMTIDARQVDPAVADTDGYASDRAAQPGQLRRDGRNKRPASEYCVLAAETDDKDAQSDAPTGVAAFGRIWIPDATRGAWSSVPAADPEDPSISTGLARGPPVLG